MSYNIAHNRNDSMRGRVVMCAISHIACVLDAGFNIFSIWTRLRHYS